jgi:hypothetical protein
VDTQYPLILTYDMTGLSLRTSAVANIHYAVTAVRFGVRPGAGELTPQVPVPIRHVRYPFGEEGPNYFSAPIPAPFADPAAPSGLRRLFSDGTAVLGGRVTHVETLFGAGRSVFVSRNLPSIFRGRYLYVQQQLQVGGLPAGLRTGSPVRVGSCTIFFRAAGHSRRLAAFQRGSVSVFISTNTLDRFLLLAYAAHLCTTGGR